MERTAIEKMAGGMYVTAFTFTNSQPAQEQWEKHVAGKDAAYRKYVQMAEAGAAIVIEECAAEAERTLSTWNLPETGACVTVNIRALKRQS